MRASLRTAARGAFGATSLFPAKREVKKEVAKKRGRRGQETRLPPEVWLEVLFGGWVPAGARDANQRIAGASLLTQVGAAAGAGGLV